jgi:hypothetical protein
MTHEIPCNIYVKVLLTARTNDKEGFQAHVAQKAGQCRIQMAGGNISNEEAEE